MREIGLIVWVVFIVIGVFANIASAVRKQQAAAAAPPRTPQPVRPPQVRTQTLTWPASATAAPTPPTSAAPVSPAPVRRPQAPAPVAPVSPLPALHEAAARRSRPFFADAPSLVRAVIAAEVLGKPRALRDE